LTSKNWNLETLRLGPPIKGRLDEETDGKGKEDEARPSPAGSDATTDEALKLSPLEERREV
jgi:hypothetical protein